jgi:hypothetical protein
VPTIAGPVDVEWLRDGSKLTLHMAVPPNAGVRVLMPHALVSVVGAGTYTLTSP